MKRLMKKIRAGHFSELKDFKPPEEEDEDVSCAISKHMAKQNFTASHFRSRGTSMTFQCCNPFAPKEVSDGALFTIDEEASVASTVESPLPQPFAQLDIREDHVQGFHDDRDGLVVTRSIGNTSLEEERETPPEWIGSVDKKKGVQHSLRQLYNRQKAKKRGSQSRQSRTSATAGTTEMATNEYPMSTGGLEGIDRERQPSEVVSEYLVNDDKQDNNALRKMEMPSLPQKKRFRMPRISVSTFDLTKGLCSKKRKHETSPEQPRRQRRKKKLRNLTGYSELPENTLILI